MTRYELAVFSNPKAGRDDEYNDWYSNQHLKDILAIPGYLSAQRFKCQVRAVGEARHGWLAIYEMDAKTSQEAAITVDALGLTQMSITDALEPEGLACAVMETCGPSIEGSVEKVTGPFRLVALANAAPGREAEFNVWYDTVHMQEVSASPGFTWAKRTKALQIVSGEFPNLYLVIYGLEASSIEIAGEALQHLSTTMRTMADAAGELGSLAIYEAVTERMSANWQLGKPGPSGAQVF